MIPSKLILESGEVFPGVSPPWQKGSFFGEIVFSTGMSGYVESLTDPSYAGQLLSFTYPLIGNYGVPNSDVWESDKIQASGVIVGSLSQYTSHWQAESSFLAWLQGEKIPLISGVDTRALTRLLRKKGSSLGAISTQKRIPQKFFDPNATDLIQQVSTPKKELFGGGNKKVILVDCGMKQNILRCLAKFPIQIEKVPFDYDYSEEPFDALFLSNGPGDPARAKKTIAVLKKALLRKKPTFGICLGAQLLALAIGAKTHKLKFGHRGQNHPCIDLIHKKAILTSQNHGFAIDEKTLPAEWTVTHRSLNDGSVEGIKHKKSPFSAVQFHPESHPGPDDAAYLFDQFYETFR